MILFPSTCDNIRPNKYSDTTNNDDDDLGPRVSMAVEAQNEEQFLRLSYKLKRTTSLRMGRKMQNGNSEESHQMKQFLKESRQCRTFGLPSEENINVKDDVSIGQGTPDKYVDYLSYRWNDFEVINSWKFIRLARKWCNERKNLQMGTSSTTTTTTIEDKNLKPSELYNRRLENMSWRIWFKLKLSLTLQSNNSNNSNHDMTWLYGPLIHRDQSCSKINIHTLNNKENNQIPYIKPILKKRNLGETLEKNSLWRLRKVKRNIKRRSSLDYRHIRQHTRLNIPTSNPYFVDDPLIESNDSSNFSSSSNSSSFTTLAAVTTTENSHKINNTDSTTIINSPILNDDNDNDVRHIRFNNNVQQCIAIHKSNSNLDLKQKKIKDIIQPLPSTQLNYYSGSESDSSSSDSNSCSDEECDNCKSNNNIDKHHNYIKNKNKSKAVSHNVNTSRRYPYIYDYNSVYTGDVSKFLPKDYSCDIIDLPQGLGLELNVPQTSTGPSPIFETDLITTGDETLILSPTATTPSISPLHSIIVASTAFSTPQTPLSSSAFGCSSTTSTLSTEGTETSSVQTMTKTRDFITGQLICNNSKNKINGTDQNKNSNQILNAIETPPTLFNPKFKSSPTPLANFIFNSSDESDI
ncbi:similar to Saccharomyces cerevisiae YBR050C REG2 Regulatory subunit of the Glc7p type-1 protein phosphatase [Maudiozyma saulgeensis]|uniref:Similar to Saccharomyces cerevisiae YBR050C REG2 Regulatory subunit of the Glc7p type-1 protein phosphatase n=1 Tax=Maudiozyma saulgeensis TaxID=1789683 RepID=A0A1X7R6V5_9SACH|nr:similar to Saccharomyces cerevisiae YBR050C REG2 Regulatory subunit of the Glc7p type-1 protein phosphatase [Kazachstania saulgeensis]